MATRKFKIKIEGKVFEAEVEEIGGGSPVKTTAAPVVQQNISSPPPATGAAGKSIVAPMPGKVISIKVTKGQQIAAGDTVAILEAMKMEQEIKAALSGIVTDISVKEGETVTKNQPLILLG